MTLVFCRKIAVCGEVKSIIAMLHSSWSSICEQLVHFVQQVHECGGCEAYHCSDEAWPILKSRVDPFVHL